MKVHSAAVTVGLLIGYLMFASPIWVDAQLNMEIDRTAGGTVEVDIQWPASFTNTLEIFATTNLVIGPWIPVCTDISTLTSTSFIWTDSAAPEPACFYIAANADCDTDADWISDAREIYIHKTFPEVWDSDQDGLWDGFEVVNHLNPLSPPGQSEADVDNDSDQLPDALELLFFSDLNQNATNDWDGDGLLNEEEFVLIQNLDDPFLVDSPWVEAPSNAATVAWNNNDEAFVSLDIGFAFPFLGISYSNLYAGINGTCSFGSAYGAWNGVSLLPNGSAHALAAPFWSDLQMTHGRAKYFSRTNEAAQSFVVLWEDVSFYGKSASSLNFQMELFSNGSLLFRYGEMDFAGATPITSIGIQDHNGEDGKSWKYAYNLSSEITNGLAVFFPAKASMIRFTSYPDTLDSDHDGIDDHFETKTRFMNPLDQSDASGDWDLDGLDNLTEYRAGTELDLADTDGDGFPDGFEIASGFNPTNSLDPDRTGLADLDADGMPDLWELYYMGGMDFDGYGNADGDALTNEEEYLAGTNPFSTDTDGDGLADGADEAPLSSGPRVFFETPRPDIAVQGEFLSVTGTVEFQGVVDSVRIGNQETVISEGNEGWRFSATIKMPPEGNQTLSVTASGHHQEETLASQTRLPVCVDALPPKLAMRSVSNGSIFRSQYAHLTVHSDDTASVVVNGRKMAQDGFMNYAWVELVPGPNIITVSSADKGGKIATRELEVYCDVPPGHSEAPPKDADQDGVLDAFDSAPNDPSISGSISFSSHKNGSSVVSTMGTRELDQERTLVLKGHANPNSRLKIRTHPLNTLRGCDRVYPVVAGSTGLFEQAIKLFPGTNEIFTTCGSERNGQVIHFDVPASPIEFQAHWNPPDLHMYTVISFGPAWGGGKWMDAWSLVGGLNSECPIPNAGLYHSWIEPHRFKELWYYTPQSYSIIIPGGTMAMDMMFGGEIIYSKSIDFTSVWDTRFNGHSESLEVAKFQTGSVVIHSKNRAGGYIVDDTGKRDLAPQGMYIGEDGWSILYHDPSHGNQWAGDCLTNYTINLTLNGPDGTEDIIIPAENSVQFEAFGTFRKELGGTPNDKLCSIFAVDPVKGSKEDAFIDEAGVFTGMKGGHYQVSIKRNAALKTLTEYYTTNDVPAINVYVIDPPALVPDYNRDGTIDATDIALSEANTFHHFWVNDDDDSGDIAEDDSDVPGQGGWFDSANHEDRKVNGRCDLLDFFPVWIDLHDTLSVLPPGDGIEYILRHDDEAVRFVYTDLTTGQANDFLTAELNGYGSAFNQYAFATDTMKVTDSGVALDADFLNRIMNDPTKGILMVEAIKSSVEPLVLEIWRDGHKLIEGELNLSLAGVENMYRWVNLRAEAGGSEQRPTDTSEPRNLPDARSNGKNFIFVHGYSVHEEAARAWNAELFKRLYQSGSMAMFTAVTWQGNNSQIWEWIPFIGGSTPDYYENVENAFATAPHLARVLPTLPGTKVIAGHSLGNMVVSSALVDHGLQAESYFMLNAAVATEAYNETLSNAETMRHPSWSDYAERLQAAKWNTLFPADDCRSKLTWCDRFGEIHNAFNYYSSTEDVLQASDGNVPDLGRVQAWVCQEMRKGTTLIWLGPGNAEAGWGFNNGYDFKDGNDTYRRMPPDLAAELSDSDLRDKSFFAPYDDSVLYSDSGAAFLLDGRADVRYSPIYHRLLADAIPALSNPAGGRSIGNSSQGNRDYMSHGNDLGFRRGLYKNGDWPRNDDRWWHSDIKNIAFPYISKVYKEIINDGGLK